MRDFIGQFGVPSNASFHMDRTDWEGGGALVYVQYHLSPVKCKHVPGHKVLGVDIKMYRILVAYWPPHWAVEMDNDLYQNCSNSWTVPHSYRCVISNVKSIAAPIWAMARCLGLWTLLTTTF